MVEVRGNSPIKIEKHKPKTRITRPSTEQGDRQKAWAMLLHGMVFSGVTGCSPIIMPVAVVTPDQIAPPPQTPATYVVTPETIIPPPPEIAVVGQPVLERTGVIGDDERTAQFNVTITLSRPIPQGYTGAEVIIHTNRDWPQQEAVVTAGAVTINLKRYQNHQPAAQ